MLLYALIASPGIVLHAQPVSLPGMVQVDDSTYMDVSEASVADWFAADIDTELGRPAADVLAQLPYGHFFPGAAAPARYANVGTVRTRHGALTLKIDADSLRTKEQRYRAERLMSYPIVGITREQATAYCNALTERYRMQHEWEDDGSYREVVFGLPEPELYDRLLSQRDSTNGKCALFNYACEPCQSLPKGRDAFIHPGRETTPVDGYMPDWRGLYNLRGNAAEMTSVPGVAKGGSYAHPAKAALPGNEQRYDVPQPWLGFRCIARVRPR